MWSPHLHVGVSRIGVRCLDSFKGKQQEADHLKGSPVFCKGTVEMRRSSSCGLRTVLSKLLALEVQNASQGFIEKPAAAFHARSRPGPVSCSSTGTSRAARTAQHAHHEPRCARLPPRSSLRLGRPTQPQVVRHPTHTHRQATHHINLS